MVPYETYVSQGGETALQEMEEFFMETGKVHQTLRELVKRLNEAGIPYALLGAMAMGEHGFTRATVDLDVLLTPQGLEDFKARFVGLGYIPVFPGAKKAFRATETGVRIDFILTGEYPGDGKPKPVRFPDPAEAFQEIRGIRVITLERLIELKLASGMTAKHRLHDLGDVLRLIRHLRLPADFANRLDVSVQPRFQQLWQDAQAADNVEEDYPSSS